MQSAVSFVLVQVFPAINIVLYIFWQIISLFECCFTHGKTEFIRIVISTMRVIPDKLLLVPLAFYFLLLLPSVQLPGLPCPRPNFFPAPL